MKKKEEINDVGKMNAPKIGGCIVQEKDDELLYFVLRPEIFETIQKFLSLEDALEIPVSKVFVAADTNGIRYNFETESGAAFLIYGHWVIAELRFPSKKGSPAPPPKKEDVPQELETREDSKVVDTAPLLEVPEADDLMEQILELMPQDEPFTRTDVVMKLEQMFDFGDPSNLTEIVYEVLGRMVKEGLLYFADEGFRVTMPREELDETEDEEAEVEEQEEQLSTDPQEDCKFFLFQDGKPLCTTSKNESATCDGPCRHKEVKVLKAKTPASLSDMAEMF